MQGDGECDLQSIHAVHVCHFFSMLFFFFSSMDPWGKSATVCILHGLQGFSFLPWSTSTCPSFSNTVVPSTASSSLSPQPTTTPPLPHVQSIFYLFLNTPPPWMSVSRFGCILWLALWRQMETSISVAAPYHRHHPCTSHSWCWHQHPVQPFTRPHKMFVIEEALKWKAFM